ncbi:hypothetical protein JEQ12_010764 [Ovis aries]|uniref:Uncharacterized protein n=1 Tax=Ovis aries TaxID=9940 RepID=A0A835ZN84_SHEEP|nr:hypothetical protein JEQ12_010764 [Ovis aries]
MLLRLCVSKLEILQAHYPRSLEQNERADVEASQVVRLQTMSKREGGELSLHERSWNAHGLGRVGFDRNALVVRKDQKEPN